MSFVLAATMLELPFPAHFYCDLHQVKDVTFRYEPGADPIFKDLNFNVDLKTRCALLGRNGCGKSTLVKLISGRCDDPLPAFPCYSSFWWETSSSNTDFSQEVWLIFFGLGGSQSLPLEAKGRGVIGCLASFLSSRGAFPLLWLCMSRLDPTKGEVLWSNHLRVASFTQHHMEQLNLDQTPLEHLLEHGRITEPTLTPDEVRGRLPVRSIAVNDRFTDA